ncbi:MAG: serine/threonine-protein kinase [Deltaproteobacteria bacterium]|nr:serine/threonine-protein kinase [Deltaproteobacteria bacterium]
MSSAAERWQLARTIFDRAVELAGEEREAYLDRSCRDDASLRSEVLGLLEADPGASGILSPAVAVAADALVEGQPPLQEILGPYRILEELGRGGMGVVYKAVRADGTYEQEVAIKVMSRHLGTENAAERFRTERQILADLDHPAIARLLDGGTTEDGSPYLVMEYVAGENIDSYCRRKHLNLEERLELALRICDAVSHAHGRLVVHRDLKPANILITENGDPKLLDFGIAKILDANSNPSLTHSGTLPMTPRYAAPEQISGKAITVATDIYNLGVIFYELLSGESPYGEVDDAMAMQLAQAILDTEPIRLSVAARRAAARGTNSFSIPARHLEGDLDAIIGTALRKEPERRYSSAEQLASDIRRLMAGQPVSAFPDSWSYRTGKWLRRNAVSAALITLVFLALAVGLVARTLEAQRAERQTERANTEAATANQVASFLETLFASAAPKDVERRDMTVRQVLDLSVERIETELSEQPEVQARLLRAIGTAYTSLGIFAEGEDLLRLSLDKMLQHAPASKERIALVQVDLAGVLQDAQRSAEAEPLLRAAVATWEGSKRKGEADHIYALQQLGMALNHQMKLDQAEQALVQASALARQQPTPDLMRQMSLDFVLGGLYADQGKPNSAHEVMLHGLGVARELYGPEHFATLIGLNNVGQTLVELGRPEDAEEYLTEGLKIATGLLEPDHPIRGTVERNLGASLARQGRLEEAEVLLGEALANHVKLYGEEQFLTHLVKANIALVRLRQGRLEEAHQGLAKALEAIEPAFGADHLVVAEILQYQGEVLQAQGHSDQARELFSRALEIRLEVFGEDGAPSLETRDALEGFELDA